MAQPFYPSALADGGYAVDDYRAVDPRVGSPADFDALAATLHAAGLELIVDIVPNHTSNRHAWFREALTAGRGSDARDRYIFWEGRGPGGERPPNACRFSVDRRGSGWRTASGTCGLSVGAARPQPVTTRRP